METHSLDRWQHAHEFLHEHHARNERKTWLVIALTFAMMVGEIAGGTYFGSLALVADGWHMATHAGALLIAALAYTYARRHVHDRRFAFGTGKLGDLAAFASAIILALIAGLIAYEALERIVSPIAIRFDEAIAVAALGLAVNVASALLLNESAAHAHVAGHDQAHDHRRHAHAHGGAHAHEEAHAPRRRHRDNNLRSAYVHVLADAATSVLAIVGLLAGRLYGLVWMDAVMGLIGAGVIASWSASLIRSTAGVLLDVTADRALGEAIRARLETGGDRVTDLHLWQIGPGHYGVIVALLSRHPRAPSHYKSVLGGLDALCHVTVEVEPLS